MKTKLEKTTYQRTLGEHVIENKEQLLKEGMTQRQVCELAFALNGLVNLKENTKTKC